MTENVHGLYQLLKPTDIRLNQASELVPLEQIISTGIQLIINGMLDLAAGTAKNPKTMVGLAAAQIGIFKRIMIVDTATTGMGETPKPTVYINPIVEPLGTETERGREGCFSTGCVCGIVERFKQVHVTAFDRDGNAVDEIHNGMTARIFQHESDHFEGIRFPDRVINEADLHWVEPDEFPDWRQNWASWQKRCDRSTWEAMKAGVLIENYPSKG